MRYIDDVLLRVEIGVLLMGSFITTMVFMFLAIIAKIVTVASGSFPRSLYRVLAWFGIASIFDFLFMIIENLIRGLIYDR